VSWYFSNVILWICCGSVDTLIILAQKYFYGKDQLKSLLDTIFTAYYWTLLSITPINILPSTVNNEHVVVFQADSKTEWDEKKNVKKTFREIGCGMESERN